MVNNIKTLNNKNFANTVNKKIKLFSGNTSKQLAQKISDQIQVPIACMSVGKFSDGECSVSIGESVRGCDTFVIQSTSDPVNDSLMELLVIIDALKRASAARITAVMPYFGYARQDRKARSRDPITAKLIADLITTAGADRVLTMDLHAAQLQGFFDIPVDHLYGIPVLRNYLKEQRFFDEHKDVIIVSPDVGSVSRARQFATKLNLPIAIVDKRRPKPNEMEVMNIVGDVAGKTCLIVDDMIDTAGTIVKGAEALLNVGKAKNIYACCTHGVLSGQAINKIKDSCIKKMFILDTIQLPSVKKIAKIVEISVDKIFAIAINSIFFDLSLSDVFE
ncbi:MAG: ribose-phosphate pyrophosphokinase [Clostridiales bacterium]|jgi:ribose-phosphate pyrophosphokinase|nr:ribose-phosphate pyrophosphokinase [Clostridiales bacterium]